MERSRIARLQHSLYPAQLISYAAQEFDKLCSVASMPDGDGSILTILPKVEAPDETADEFLNFVMCAALECHLSK
jgi:hypothetical protein